MSSPTSSPQQPKKRSALLITLIVVAILAAAFVVSANVITDVLWFEQLGYLRVFFTEWVGYAVMFVIGFVAMAAPLYVVSEIAFRKRPVYARINSQLDAYQKALEPLQKMVRLFVPALLGVFAGVAVSNSWRDVLLWFHSEATGTLDPLHGLDLQFYMFALPVFDGAVLFAQTVLLAALVVTVAVSYIYGGIAFSGKDFRVAKSTRVLLGVLLACYVATFGVQYWLGQYSVLTNSSGLFTGATYADVHARIPGMQILAGIGVVVAVLFIITAVRGKWRLSVTGTAMFIAASVVLSSGYPWAVQQFKVGPDEKSLEAEYLSHNIAATRAAYGVDNIEVERYDAVTTATAGALRDDAVATANIRIMDPAVIAPTFAQLEQSKQYYRFHDTLSVDRYQIDGRVEDTVSVPREIDVSQQTGWYNRSLVYTHGYGLVAAYGNQRAQGGEPVFLENGIPTSGKLGEFEPRIYFGRYSPLYSIVGGERSKPIEVDYPADVDTATPELIQPATEDAATAAPNDAADAAATSADTANDNAGSAAETETADASNGDSPERQNLTTFSGNGGPVLHGVFEKLLYALKFQDVELLLSEAVVDGSQILYNRNPVDRVAAAAPYLTLDRQPYASVVDGRVVWIVDGYTTSSRYPYSAQRNMSEMLLDADNTTAGAPQQINYIRNAVKATVDAYDGSVKLYAWDENDPLLRAWQKIYPETLLPVSEMSADLLSHVRYPNDLFKVQREILGDYHVTDPGAFYSKEDAWKTPEDPVSRSANAAPAAVASTVETDSLGEAGTVSRSSGVPAQPPYYLTLSAGANSEPTFSIYSTFIPNQSGDNARDILTGYLAADANAGTGKNGEVNANYGKLKLLVLPKGSAISGPGQVQNSFSTDAKVASVLNILRRGETDVISGNLLTLPVGGGLLYVQPVYVKAKAQRGYPLLQKVLVSFGDQIAFEDTLDQALDSLFGGNSGASAGDGDIEASVTTPDAGEAAAAAPQQSQQPQLESLNAALAEMKQALADRDKARAAGDWAAYGAADKRLQQALEQALELSGEQDNN